jgi:hypothetical protein
MIFAANIRETRRLSDIAESTACPNHSLTLDPADDLSACFSNQNAYCLR